REAPAEQQHEPDPGAEEVLDAGIGLWPVGGGAKPPHQEDRAEAQRDPGEPVQDRQHRSELPAIDLQVRRQWPLGGAHAQGPTNSQLASDLDRAPGSVHATEPIVMARFQNWMATMRPSIRALRALRRMRHFS